MGVILAHRTTHEFRLTSDGQALLATARRIVGEWDMLKEQHQDSGVLRGEIKVVAPIALGQTLLAKAAAKFLAMHPKVSLDWRVTDSTIRFAEEGCDCWFRVGEVPDQTLVVRKIAEAERIVVGSPSLAGEGVEQPGDLPWLSLAPFEADSITLFDAKGRPVGLSVQPRMRSDNILTLLEGVLQGIGVAIMPRWLVGEAILAGELLELFPQLRASSLPISIALPAGTRRPARVDAFAEAIGEELGRML